MIIKTGIKIAIFSTTEEFFRKKCSFDVDLKNLSVYKKVMIKIMLRMC